MWQCKKCGCDDFYLMCDVKFDKEGNIEKVNETICCTNCDNYGDEIQDIAESNEDICEGF